VLGWIAGVTGTTFFVGSLIVTLVATNNPSYTPTNWQGTMLLWAMLLIGILLNTIFNRILPSLEIFVLMFVVQQNKTPFGLLN